MTEDTQTMACKVHPCFLSGQQQVMQNGPITVTYFIAYPKSSIWTFASLLTATMPLFLHYWGQPEKTCKFCFLPPFFLSEGPQIVESKIC